MEIYMTVQTSFCRQKGWTNKTNNYSFVTPSVDYEITKKPQNGNVIAYRPYNLNFTCERRSEVIDKSMVEIYENALKGSVKIEQNPHKLACHTFKGLSGNVRQFLHECRCPLLDRHKNPKFREAFEKTTIEAIEKMGVSNNQSINIAMFATGGLLGEWVFMLKLINHLHNKMKFKGIINIFLIDQVYKNVIEKAGAFTSGPKPQLFSWKKFIGECDALNQFLTEIALILPPTIKVVGSVFAEAHEYIARAKADVAFRHDIVIGADIESVPYKTDKIVSNLKEQASRRDVPGIVLDKIKNVAGQLVPMLCQVGPTKGTSHFVCKPI